MAIDTTTGQGARMTTMSKRSRPATGGNKNIQSRARRKSASDQKSKVAGIFSRTHTGPYLGKQST